MKMNRFLFAVSVSLAMALTFSCTEDTGDDEVSSSSGVDGSSPSTGNSSSGGTNSGRSSSSVTVSGPEQAISLTAGQWTIGDLVANYEGYYYEAGEVWYKFEAVAGTTYRIWWDDYYTRLSGSSDLVDITITAYDSNLNFEEDPLFWADDDVPATVTLTTSGTVYLKVAGGNGTFGIAYSASSTMPAIYPARGTEDNPIALKQGEWKFGYIYGLDDDFYYTFEARANTNYYFWMDDYDTENYYADAMVLIYDEDGDLLVGGDSWIDIIQRYSPEVIRLASSGTVYINVFPNYDFYDEERNFFRIRYNTVDDSDDIFYDYDGYY
jgi:hypothetical protein